MDFSISRIAPAARQFGVVQIHGQTFQLRPTGATLVAAPPREHPSPDLQIENPPAEDYTPAARARKAKRRIRRMFTAAKLNAKGRARLCRADEYEILLCAYRAVRAWRSDEVHENVERELRAGAEVALSRRPSLFLLLLRCALPRLAIRRASKWAAALETADRTDVRPKRLPAFLHNHGGVEGAARARAKFKRERERAI